MNAREARLEALTSSCGKCLRPRPAITATSSAEEQAAAWGWVVVQKLCGGPCGCTGACHPTIYCPDCARPALAVLEHDPMRTELRQLGYVQIDGVWTKPEGGT